MSAPISRAFKGAASRKPNWGEQIERGEGTERERNVKPDPFNYPVWNSRPPSLPAPVPAAAGAGSMLRCKEDGGLETETEVSSQKSVTMSHVHGLRLK